MNAITSFKGGVALSVFAFAFLLFGNTAFAQNATTTTPIVQAAKVMVTMNVSPNSTQGTRSTLAIITLDATGATSTPRVTSIPIAISSGTGSSFSNCSLADIASLGTSVSNSIPLGGTFTLNSPVVVPMNGVTTLALLCDTSSTAQVGSTVSLSIAPSSVQAADNVSGVAIVPTTGTSGSVSGTNTIIAPVPATPPVVTPPPTPIPETPGVPNTGFGDAPTNYLVLAISGLLGALGVLYVRKQKRI